MRKGDALLRGSLTDGEALRVVVLLASMGIEAATDHDSTGKLEVYVAVEDLERAARLVAEEAAANAVADGPIGSNILPSRSASGMRMDATPGDDLVAPEAWFGRGTGAVLALIAACVAVYFFSQNGPEAGSRSRMLAAGAISYAQIHAGEYWRFVSAIFVHFDVSHLIANMSVMLILAPPLAHQVGAARFVALFIASGIGGNVASHILAPSAGLKAGASGAIAGVLGALGGLALRPEQQTRYRSWQRLGAMAAIYGMLVGFGPGRDNVAHLAGLIVGLALGRWVRPLGRSEL